MRVPPVILRLRVRSVILLVNALMRSAWMLMTVSTSSYSPSSLLPGLLGVSTILARPHSGVWTNDLSLHPEQRLVDLDELVDKVVEALLVIDISCGLDLLTIAVAFEVLRQHLPQVLVQLFSVLILCEVLLVVLDEFLYLLLKLLV